MNGFKTFLVIVSVVIAMIVIGLVSDTDQKTNEISALREQNQRLQQQVAALDFEDLRMENAELKAQLLALRGENERLAHALAQSEAQRTGLVTYATALHEQNQRLIAELDVSRRETQMLSAETRQLPAQAETTPDALMNWLADWLRNLTPVGMFLSGILTGIPTLGYGAHRFARRSKFCAIGL